MKLLKYIIGGSLLLFGIWFFFIRDTRKQRLMREGHMLSNKIEEYKIEHKKLPNSLEDIGIKETDGVDVLYYTKRDSTNYTISFGTSLGESKFYYSDTKQWEDKYREM